MIKISVLLNIQANLEIRKILRISKSLLVMRNAMIIMNLKEHQVYPGLMRTRKRKAPKIPVMTATLLAAALTLPRGHGQGRGPGRDHLQPEKGKPAENPPHLPRHHEKRIQNGNLHHLQYHNKPQEKTDDHHHLIDPHHEILGILVISETRGINGIPVTLGTLEIPVSPVIKDQPLPNPRKNERKIRAVKPA